MVQPFQILDCVGQSTVQSDKPKRQPGGSPDWRSRLMIYNLRLEVAKAVDRARVTLAGQHNGAVELESRNFIR